MSKPSDLPSTTISDAFINIQELYFQLRVNQRLYINAILTLIAFLLTYSVFGLEVDIAKGFLGIFLIFWIAAICYDSIALYKKVYETLLGKALLILLLALGSNFAYVLSGLLVNEITGVDPSYFPHTITLLSILSIPFFILGGIGILFFAILLISPLFLMFHMLPSKKEREVLFPGYSSVPSIPYQKTTLAIQFMSLAFFCGFVWSLSQKSMDGYNKFLTNTARSFLYQMEMYSKAPCDIGQGARVAFIGDDRILVGTKKSSAEIVFEIRECKPKGS